MPMATYLCKPASARLFAASAIGDLQFHRWTRMSTSLPDSREIEIKKERTTIMRREGRPEPAERASSQECTASTQASTYPAASISSAQGPGFGQSALNSKLI